MPSVFRAFILWLHLLGAILWIGGLLFQVLVIFPILARRGATVERIRLGLSLEARFRTVMWPAVGLVLFTGLVNLLNVWHATVMLGSGIPAVFAWVLGSKILLVLGMVLLLFLLQFVVQPRRLAALGSLPLIGQECPHAFQKLQRLALGLYMLLTGLAAAVVWCAVLLRGM